MRGMALAGISALVLAAALIHCGGGSAPPAPHVPSGSVTWEQTNAVIQKDCAGCHNGSYQPSLTPSSVFLASPAKSLIESGQMPPPPSTMSAADKATLLSYLN